MEGVPLVLRGVSREEMPLICDRLPGGGLSCDIVELALPLASGSVDKVEIRCASGGARQG